MLAYVLVAWLLQSPDAVHFAVLGDYGTDSAAEAQVADLIHSWAPDFVITVGDNNYPAGRAETLDANIGQYYHDFILFDPTYRGAYRSMGAATQRFFASLGNHDWRTPGAAPYMNYFALPGNERYYNVRQGPVELFALDSDTHEPDGIDADSPQAAWLQQALAASTAPWKIVYLHHPPYSTGAHGSSPRLRWPFSAWGATWVIAGHDHNYERITHDNMPYFVAGTGGAGLRRARSPLQADDAHSELFYAERHGAASITADDTALTWEFYTVDGDCIDRVVTPAPSLRAAPPRAPTTLPLPACHPPRR